MAYPAAATIMDYSKFQVVTSKSVFTPADNDAMNKLLERVMNPSCTKKKVNRQRSTSAFGKDRNHCLCKVLRPIILFWQIFCVLPVSHDRETCTMTHSWTSKLAFVNFTWIGGNILGIFFGVPVVRKLVMAGLSGIDMYAFGFVMAIQYSVTILIFLVGNFNAKHFLKAWAELHAVTEEIAMPNFRRVKRLAYILPVILTHEFIMNICVFTWLKITNVKEVQGVPFQAQIGMFMANFIPNLLAGIYGVFLGIIARNFKILNRKLEAELQKKSNEVNIGKHWDPLLALQISRFRLLHEKLCQSVRYLEWAFGIQILGVFGGTCINFVTGVYSFIIGTQGLAPPGMERMMISFGIGAIFAATRVMAIIWFSQNVMNEASGTAHVLNNFNSDTCSDEVNAQIARFLQKLGDFPLHTRCCNVFQLGNGFYATAASVIVTYVLILIQFRIDNP